MEEFMSLPRTAVVELDKHNPWLVVSRSGFSWRQLLASNLCSAVVGAVWTASLLF